MTAPPPGTGRALAVIAKRPLPGQVKTRLAPAFGAVGAARAAAAMLADTLATVRAVEADRWLCFAPARARAAMAALAPGFGLLAQPGGGLGARLAACLDGLLAAGAGRVAIVGADTPHLPPATCAAAFALLEEVDVVLGPALDGGYYLVAAKAPAPELFAGVPMGTDRVLAATIGRAEAAGLTVGLLPALRDLDTPDDLAAALAAGELAASPATSAVAAELLGANW
jgi:rSAM/selenodomain-associated transferase 1